MIQRKIDGAGNVVGYYDTEERKWVPENDFDETTDQEGVVLDADVAQKKVDRRLEEIKLAEDEAANPRQPAVVDPDRDPETEDEEYADMTNAELRGLLKSRGVDVPSGAIKSELVELAKNSDEVVE